MTKPDIAKIENRIDELFLSFEKMKLASGEEFDTLYGEVKTKARGIHYFMGKLKGEQDAAEIEAGWRV